MIETSDISKQIAASVAVLRKTLPDVCYAALIDTAIEIEGAAKTNVPHKTSNLARTITHEGDKPTMTVIVGTNTEYGPYVEYGTGIFSEFPSAPKTRIVPKVKKALSWLSGGERITVKSIAGMTPRPFLRPAFLAKGENFGKNVDYEMTKQNIAQNAQESAKKASK
jgi:HK97 gp10 family phage protein